MISLIAAAALAPTVAIERLENGATLVAIEIAGAKTFSAQTFLRYGSVYETEPGAAHLLEHLLFTDGEADTLAENAGLLLDATTYREFMRLHTVGKASSWKSGAAAVARLLRPPSVAFAEKEAKVIAQEDELARLDPDEMVHRALWQSGAKGTAWAKLPMGDVGRTPSVSGEFERFVVGSNVVAVVASALPSSEVLTELRSHYKGLAKGETSVPPALPPWSPSLKETASTRLGIAAAAAGYDKPASFLAAEIAIEALTAPSRIEHEELSARSFLTPSSRGSLAVISIEAIDGVPGLSPRISRLFGVPITIQEVAIAKARVQARYAMELPINRALTAGLAVLFTGNVIDFASEIERVPLEEVTKFAVEFSK